MSTTVKIPMNEETRIDLEDCFVDTPNTDARKFVFDNLKQACQDAKRSVRNKVTPVNRRQEDGAMKQEEFELKGIDLEKFTLPSNEAWLPKGMSAEDNNPIELKLGDSTMKFLKHFGQLVIIRHEQYNMAEEAYLAATEAKMMENGAKPEQIESWKKQQESIKATRLEAVPNCLEQAIYTSIWPMLVQKLDMSDGKIFEDEYKEIYKQPEETKPTVK